MHIYTPALITVIVLYCVFRTDKMSGWNSVTTAYYKSKAEDEEKKRKELEIERERERERHRKDMEKQKKKLEEEQKKRQQERDGARRELDGYRAREAMYGNMFDEVNVHLRQSLREREMGSVKLHHEPFGSVKKEERR